MNIKMKLLKTKNEEKSTKFMLKIKCCNLHVVGINLCYHNNKLDYYSCEVNKPSSVMFF